jgi:XTP/dITP diphosphohydrolase
VTAGPDEQGSPLAALADLVAVMDRLRSPGGCPWDAQQTHESLLPYAVEEVFEVVEAVEDGDRAALREELGDLLLQVVFHARLAQEHPTDPFGIGEVAAGIAAKLRSRHPHVFGPDAGPGPDAGGVAGGAAAPADGDLHRRWDEAKRVEKARESALDGIPRGMPALTRAEKVLGRARRAGLPVERVAADVVGPAEGRTLGRSLLALALEAHAAGRDAEAELRAAVRELEAALRAAERTEGSAVEEASPGET